MIENVPGSLIVQSDGSLLLDVHAPTFEQARNDLAPFAELEKSPEHIHTYRMTRLSLWNACSAGIGPNEVAEALQRHARFAVPRNVLTDIHETMGRYGKVRLVSTTAASLLYIVIDDEAIYEEVRRSRPVAKLIVADPGDIESPAPNARYGFFIQLYDRGTIKQELVRIGYPVDDRAPLVEGDPLDVRLRSVRESGGLFEVRDYQREAAEAFHGDGRVGTGYGTIVLPCGAGKTIVGMTVMAMIKTNTLIITTNIAAVHQWMDELIDKTELTPDQVGEYTGAVKTIRPVTISTYQILVWRSDREGVFPHFELFRARNWGLIIYDEVHLLPAPIFRVTAEIQALRRLGLTATLVREDNHERDVFSLVGPKRYDVPWKELEQRGWIAEAECFEIRIDLPRDVLIDYATADRRVKARIAGENPRKALIARELVENHPEDLVLVIGQYLSQLDHLAKALDAPLITGKTPNARREELYAKFRTGEIRVLVVSKVANFAIDLPDASVAIQVSGSFGSRQEEAQRLGRILRPKKKNSYFYSVISRRTVEEDYSAHRQQFLTEQGYRYRIETWDDFYDR